MALLIACSNESSRQDKDEELVKTVNVHVREMHPQTFRSYVKLVGTVSSDSDVEIAAEATGRVLKYYVDKGETISKGDPILKIDDRELKAERERLEALTESSYENYKRLENLLKKDGIGSEIDVINARSEYRQNKAALESVKIQIHKTLVEAPFNAIMEEKLVEEGEMASASLGTMLFRLVSSEILKVKVGVPARYADVIKPGDPAKIWFDTDASDTLQVPISFVGNSIDSQSRTFTVEMPIPNRRQYKIDMIANVRLQTIKRDQVMVVNQQYIRQQNDGSYVLYVQGEHQGDPIALKRVVIPGAMFQGRIIIEKGLKTGDRLVTVGSSFLQDSMRINVVKTENVTLANKQ